MMAFLGVLYVIMVIDFMVLYCLFFVKVEGDPGAADLGTSDLKIN